MVGIRLVKEHVDFRVAEAVPKNKIIIFCFYHGWHPLGQRACRILRR
jgi:hypothetical protein